MKSEHRGFEAMAAKDVQVARETRIQAEKKGVDETGLVHGKYQAKKYYRSCFGSASSDFRASVTFIFSSIIHPTIYNCNPPPVRQYSGATTYTSSNYSTTKTAIDT